LIDGRIRNTELTERSGLPPTVDLIVRKHSCPFGHVTRFGDDTCSSSPSFAARSTSDGIWKGPPGRTWLKKQVAGSDSLWQQPSPPYRWFRPMWSG